MNNNKPSSSSIDWLISQLQKSKDWHRVLNEVSQMSSARIDILEQAKAMHKEESVDFALYAMMAESFNDLPEATKNQLQEAIEVKYKEYYKL